MLLLLLAPYNRICTLMASVTSKPAPETPSTLRARGGCYHGSRGLSPQTALSQKGTRKVLAFTCGGIQPRAAIPARTGGMSWEHTQPAY